ncbi:hypothetical protein HHK36_001782 [Tetracentron sinense]|uniref:RING-type E3 ubiquitin transferase n=1 Tax=Tetracentron sinense TaxID=13715 RepID=A0A834ZTE3_TETSI|nr:hypothetical protein HHK36_001782 [Tetracentron sinense]
METQEEMGKDDIPEKKLYMVFGGVMERWVPQILEKEKVGIWVIIKGLNNEAVSSQPIEKWRFWNFQFSPSFKVNETRIPFSNCIDKKKRRTAYIKGKTLTVLQPSSCFLSMGDPNDNNDDLPFRRSPPFPPERKQLNFNSKIMLTAIISLSVVVVLVVILHIYARYVLRRQARRRIAIRQLSIGVAHANSREPPKGLDASVIASLPLFVYKQTESLDDTAMIECAVCLSTLEEEEMARLLPNCKHTFHAECIDMWLNSHSTCPICRTEAEPRPQPENSEPGVEVPAASAPPMESMNSTLTNSEGTSDGAVQSAKVGGSGSRLSSFRRMLSRERSSRRIQPCGQEGGVEDLERQ